MTGPPGPLGLYTDLYELRMAETYLRAGMLEPATFSLFVRAEPKRPWLVALGAQRVVELLAAFRYGSEELEYLSGLGLSEQALDWLASYEPTGELWAVPEGSVVLANEPILELTGPLPHVQLLETAIVNVVQLPTLIATKAARMALAAGGRPVVDFGLRRAQGLSSGTEAAFAAYIGGGISTSNLEAGRRYGIEVVGTMAHSLVQSFPSEIEAFRAFAADHPGNTVLLVDTYDTVEGVRNAIRVADEMRARGESLRGIRLDSGDLAALALQARGMLDGAGHPDVRIFASGGLDEERIHELVSAGAPIDAFGVGTTLVVSKDLPALDIVYKLVSYAGASRAKYSPVKATLPGAKQVFRTGGPGSDVLACRDEELPGRPLLERVWKDGVTERPFDLEAAREHAHKEAGALPEDWKLPPYPASPPAPALSPRLRELDERLRSEHLGG